MIWEIEKSKIIRDNPDRKVSFERCIIAIENGDILDDIKNPARDNQNIMILNIDDYAYVVPYVEDNEARYFKTVFPSRKYTRLYLK